VGFGAGWVGGRVVGLWVIWRSLTSAELLHNPPIHPNSNPNLQPLAPPPIQPTTPNPNPNPSTSSYLTKYDCSAADINPIGGISKGDLRRFLQWGAVHLGYGALAEVEAAPPTAELEPIRWEVGGLVGGRGVAGWLASRGWLVVCVGGEGSGCGCGSCFASCTLESTLCSSCLRNCTL